MSLINKVNFKNCFSENYKRMHLTTRVYGTLITATQMRPRDQANCSSEIPFIYCSNYIWLKLKIIINQETDIPCTQL